MVGGKFSSQCRDNHKDTYGTAFVYIYVIPTCFYIFKEKIVVLLFIPFVSPILFNMRISENVNARQPLLYHTYTISFRITDADQHMPDTLT